MKTRRRIGLAVVIGCGVVVSFSGLYSLAIACKFWWPLAVLVPVLADAGAAVAADHWLDTSVPKRVRRYAMVIALVLISASVAGNAAAHLLTAFDREAPWWLVVLVAGLAPATVASNLHLSSLVRHAGIDVAQESAEPDAAAHEPNLAAQVDDVPASDETEHLADRLGVAPARLHIAGGDVFVADPEPSDEPADDEDKRLTKAREMAAAGVGRPTLKKELGLADHVAREIVRKHKPRQEAQA